MPDAAADSSSGISRRRSTGHVSSMTTSTAGSSQTLAATAALGEQVVDDGQRVVRRRRQLRAAERAGVGQPLEERPVVQAALADEGDDGEIGRALHRRRLQHERAGEGPRRVQRPGDADAAVLQDVDGERHVVEELEAIGDLLDLGAQVAVAARWRR